MIKTYYSLIHRKIYFTLTYRKNEPIGPKIYVRHGMAIGWVLHDSQFKMSILSKMIRKIKKMYEIVLMLFFRLKAPRKKS